MVGTCCALQTVGGGSSREYLLICFLFPFLSPFVFFFFFFFLFVLFLRFPSLCRWEMCPLGAVDASATHNQTSALPSVPFFVLFVCLFVFFFLLVLFAVFSFVCVLRLCCRECPWRLSLYEKLFGIGANPRSLRWAGQISEEPYINTITRFWFLWHPCLGLDYG